jgi:hypothetical protein
MNIFTLEITQGEQFTGIVFLSLIFIFLSFDFYLLLS